MNDIRDVAVAPSRVSSGGAVVVQLSYTATPSARLRITWSPGFRVALSGQPPAVGAITTAPQPTLVLTLDKRGPHAACTLVFTLAEPGHPPMGIARPVVVEVT